MEGVEPRIPRGLISSIVAVEKLVMKLVKEIADSELCLAHFQVFKSSVAGWGADEVVEQQKQHVHRV